MSRRRAGASAAVALCMALATCPMGHARGAGAPSERDQAYERGVQAEEAGDLSLAARSFERAYRLTAATESGPRLLFLRASVAAHLRAEGGDPRAHLCAARALLREHLAGSVASVGADDPLADERASLARIELRLGAAGTQDCDAPAPSEAPVSAAPPVTPEPARPEPARPEPAPPGPSSAPAQVDAPVPAARTPGRPRVTRALRIAGAVSLGVGAASLGVMGAGIVLADRATERGRTACWKGQVTCEAFKGDITDIVADGQRADGMVRVGAVLGGLGLLAGVVLLAVSERAGRARVVGAPALAPGTAGLALSGRF